MKLKMKAIAALALAVYGAGISLPAQAAYRPSGLDVQLQCEVINPNKNIHRNPAGHCDYRKGCDNCNSNQEWELCKAQRFWKPGGFPG